MKFKSILKELKKERKTLTEQLDRLEKAIAAIGGISGSGNNGVTRIARKKPKFTKELLARTVPAQRARWKKIKAAQKK